MSGAIDLGAGVRLPLPMCTRHGLVAGATGTGKTRTLQLLAEGLSNEEIDARLHLSVPTVKTHVAGS